MKNIHVIPTDKPSKYVTNYMEQNMQWQHIYITSDEEIKEGDWVLNPTNEVQNCIGLEKGIGTDNICWVKVKETTTLQQILNSQKIILTTDQDLIKDGVQAIDDEFLEWFVKNPSCEEVEVNDWMDTNGNIAFGGDKRYQICNHLYEKIIIPKEEPEFIQINQDNPVTRGSTALVRNPKYQREMKQETLEEAVEILYPYDGVNEDYKIDSKRWSFISGAKWQQERMYSEKDLLGAFEAGMMFIGEDKGSFKEWFEQNKNK